MFRQTRSALACVALFAATLLAPARADAAGAVLAPAGEATPAVSVRMAIATGPSSTTRWSEVTLGAGPAVGWLVPIRPGATVDWAPNAWMNALDQASAPRVLAPEAAAPCMVQQSYETPEKWVLPATSLSTAAIALPASAADAEAWASGHGLAVSAAESGRISELYAAGWRVAAVELAASTARRSSPALRVTDDGGAMLPLSIGAPSLETSVTLFVVGSGPAKIAGTSELYDRDLRWGTNGSSYADLRRQLLRDAFNASGGSPAWLRESSSHAALFDRVQITPSTYQASAVATYFNSSACAFGDLGTRTQPQNAAQLTCGTRTDLAFALAGITPSGAVLTRLVGILPANRAAGTPAIVATGSERSTVRTAQTYDGSCSSSSSGDPGTPPSSSSGGGGGGGGSSGIYPPSSSSGSTSAPDDDDYWVDGSSTTVYIPSDGCSGDTTPTGDDDDWTSSGDDDDDDDGWDTTDSSSSDDCSGDTSTSTDDGWDTSDDSNCSTSARSHGHHTKRRGPSPLSRVVMFGVFLLIPLRRLTRKRTGERS